MGYQYAQTDLVRPSTWPAHTKEVVLLLVCRMIAAHTLVKPASAFLNVFRQAFRFRFWRAGTDGKAAATQGQLPESRVSCQVRLRADI